MFDHVVQQVRDEGRRQVMTGITAPAGADETYPARRFLEKRAFIYSQEDVHRMLSLPADETVLAFYLQELGGDARRVALLDQNFESHDAYSKTKGSTQL